jgi:hypothetical protein
LLFALHEKSQERSIIYFHFCKLLGKQLVSIREALRARYRKRGMRESQLLFRPPNNQYPNYTSSLHSTLCARQRTGASHQQKGRNNTGALWKEKERERKSSSPLTRLLAHLFISFASQPYNVFPQSISSGKVNELPAAGIDIHRCHQWSVRAAGACRLLQWILLGICFCLRGEKALSE